MRALVGRLLAIELFTLRGYRVTSSDALAFAAGLLAAVLVSPSGTPGVHLADNALLTITMITREALRVLRNNLTFTKRVSRLYDSKFGVEGAKIGTVLNVRKPPRYVVREGAALQPQDATETQVPVTLDTQAHVDITFSSTDLALSIDDFSNRFLKPAIAAIANRIDKKGLELYKTIANSVGTPGVTPADLDVYLSAGVKLDDESTPLDGQRSVVVTPQMQATLVNALKGLFQQSSAIASQYMKGQMGTAAGFDFYMDQNVAMHTVGPLGGTPLANGAQDNTSSLVTNGWTSSAANRLKRGDVITIANVNAVNPQSRESTGALRQFVVLADADSDGSGNLTASIYPAIVSSGANQTVDAAVVSGAAILTFGQVSSTQNDQSRTGLAFHPDAFTLVTADLPLPKSVDMAARVADEDLGISIRAIRDYSIDSDTWPCRLDVLFGWATLRPELACRIQG